jgi:uncharacterized phage protein (TIGR02220 family)
MSKKHFRLYSSDWLSDKKLRSCGISARGVLVDIMSLIHELGNGFLMKDSVPYTKESLATVLSNKNEEELFIKAFNELIDNGIILFDEKKKAFYSKKMLKIFELGKVGIDQNAIDIYAYFNKITGKKFSVFSELESAEQIKTLILDGYKKEELMRVADHMFELWKDNQAMANAIRPKVIFGKSFPEYYAMSKESQEETHKQYNGTFQEYRKG